MIYTYLMKENLNNLSFASLYITLILLFSSISNSLHSFANNSPPGPQKELDLIS